MITKEKEKTKPLVSKEDDVLPETEKIIKDAESTMVQLPKEKSPQKVYARPNGADIDPTETQEWMESLSAVLEKDGKNRELTDDAINVLQNYHWPGNVRELKNLKPVRKGDTDLHIAMKQIAESGIGPKNQIPSMGCNIKWFK